MHHVAVSLKTYRYTKHVISDLLQNRVDMSQLVITKALSKSGKTEVLLRSLSFRGSWGEFLDFKQTTLASKHM
jgi:hypothetical protein